MSKLCVNWIDYEIKIILVHFNICWKKELSTPVNRMEWGWQGSYVTLCHLLSAWPRTSDNSLVVGVVVQTDALLGCRYSSQLLELLLTAAHRWSPPEELPFTKGNCFTQVYALSRGSLHWWWDTKTWPLALILGEHLHLRETEKGCKFPQEGLLFFK